MFIAKYGKKITYYKVDFKTSNFSHFLGIKTKITPDDFFQRAVAGKTKANDFIVKNKKYTAYKLDTIFDAVAIHKNAKVIGDFGNQGIKIEADMGLGNVTYTMTLRRFKKDLNYCYPVGILKSDVRNEVFPHSPIIAILTKNIKDRLYNKCTYKSKNINFNEIHIPKELAAVMTEEVLLQIKPSVGKMQLQE
ncbi:MAG: PBECR4 domain-containing protein [Clostridiales bacterium]|nr:PBECR4 domain-containing protein [Clostridiales bacterium]